MFTKLIQNLKNRIQGFKGSRIQGVCAINRTATTPGLADFSLRFLRRFGVPTQVGRATPNHQITKSPNHQVVSGQWSVFYHQPSAISHQALTTHHSPLRIPYLLSTIYCLLLCVFRRIVMRALQCLSAFINQQIIKLSNYQISLCLCASVPLCLFFSGCGGSKSFTPAPTGVTVTGKVIVPNNLVTAKMEEQSIIYNLASSFLGLPVSALTNTKTLPNADVIIARMGKDGALTPIAGPSSKTNTDGSYVISGIPPEANLIVQTTLNVPSTGKTITVKTITSVETKDIGKTVSGTDVNTETTFAVAAIKEIVATLNKEAKELNKTSIEDIKNLITANLQTVLNSATTTVDISNVLTDANALNSELSDLKNETPALKEKIENMKTKGEIKGLVTSIADSKSLSGATIKVGTVTTTTDSSGNYTLSDISASAQTISAAKDGYNPESKDITVKAGESITVNISMTPKTLSSISISPSSAAIISAMEQDFTATCLWSDSATSSCTSDVTWTSADTAKATITSPGKVKNVSAESGLPTNVEIKVSKDGKESKVTVNLINESCVSNFVITCTNCSNNTVRVNAGNTEQFSATCTTNKGTTNYNATSIVTWNSSDKTKGDFTTTAGQFKGSSSNFGKTNITATSGTVTSSNTIEVTVYGLDSISITPTTASIIINTEQQFAATCRWSDGTETTCTNDVTWTSSDTAKATVTTGGTTGGKVSNVALESALPTTVTITASKDGKSKSVTVNLVKITCASNLVITCTNTTCANNKVNVGTGNTEQFSAACTNNEGTQNYNATSIVTWNSSDKTKGDFTTTAGQFKASTSAVGNTNVTATSGTVTSGNTIEVTVFDDDAPTANAGPDKTAKTGETVTFDGTGSSDNLGTAGLSYSWDFNSTDGISTDASGSSASTSYSSAGNYTVTLTVKDAQNSAQDTTTVTVSLTEESCSGVTTFCVDAIGPSDPVISGSTVDVPITLSNVTKLSKAVGIQMLTIKLTWDSSKLPLAVNSVTLGNNLSKTSEDKSVAGEYIITLTADPYITSDATIVTVKFNVSGTSGTSGTLSFDTSTSSFVYSDNTKVKTTDTITYKSAAISIK